jgi:6-phosphogluconate dehydrogenase
MRVGVIGLGRMGYAVAKRIFDAGHVVFGFDVDKDAVQRAHEVGIHTVKRIEQLIEHVDVYWLMLPSGPLVDQVIDVLKNCAHAESIIIDGGNSNFKDSIRRAQMLQALNISFLDCGTSGGLLGQEIGFSLMIGGQEHAYQQAMPVFEAVAMKSGYGYVGPSGAGHYVKMVHNGIEYALLQAYAEGFRIIKEGSYKDTPIDLANLSDIWMHGSVIRSYILELAHQVFQEDQDLSPISGEIAESGTGRWTVEEAIDRGIPAPMIMKALDIRAQSRMTGGDYATKLVAMLRNKFGGHAVTILRQASDFVKTSSDTQDDPSTGFRLR